MGFFRSSKECGSGHATVVPHAGLVKQRGGSSFVEQNGKIIGVKWNSKDTDFLLAECENLSSYEQFPAPPPPPKKNNLSSSYW